MSENRTEQLIDALTAQAQPVRPLAPPLRRGLATLAGLGLVGAGLVLIAGNLNELEARYSGREALMAAEMTAMLATAVLAVIGAFFLSVPGRSRRWLLAPIPVFLLWVSLSGVGCLQDLARLGPAGWGWGHGRDCLIFILGASVVVGLPLLWRLSRAHPVNPLPVALLGGLGAAALSAFLLQFFHPPALTVLDLGVHFGAVAMVMGIAALMRRSALAPA
jgi:hypothetical protein